MKYLKGWWKAYTWFMGIFSPLYFIVGLCRNDEIAFSFVWFVLMLSLAAGPIAVYIESKNAK